MKPPRALPPNVERMLRALREQPATTAELAERTGLSRRQVSNALVCYPTCFAIAGTGDRNGAHGRHPYLYRAAP